MQTWWSRDGRGGYSSIGLAVAGVVLALSMLALSIVAVGSARTPEPPSDVFIPTLMFPAQR